MTTIPLSPPQAEAEVCQLPPSADHFIQRVLQAVMELPDRTSPDDWPEACLVTGDELDGILRNELELLLQEESSGLLPAERTWRPISEAPRDGTSVLILLRQEAPHANRRVREGSFSKRKGAYWTLSKNYEVWAIDHIEGWQPLPTPPRAAAEREG